MPQRLILAVRPGRIHDAGRQGGSGLLLAHLAYRVGAGPHLFRANGPVTPHAGLMVMDAPHLEDGGDAEGFCHEVFRECVARKFTGVVCRFEEPTLPILQEICGRLSESCAQRGLTCYVSEPYGRSAPSARVLLSTAVSGGSLEGRLKEAENQFGPRLALWVERSVEDFMLPSPTGAGTPLNWEELERRRTEYSANVFFSSELCAHYFTYMAGEKAHFVLFDDAGSVRKKLQVAERLGVDTAFLPFDSVEDILSGITGETEHTSSPV